MNSLARTLAVALALTFATSAPADSYAPFQDILEVDRDGLIFANVRGSTASFGQERVSIVVWTRLHDRVLQERRAQKNAAKMPNLEASVSPGVVYTVVDRVFDRLPLEVRVGASSVAILDYYGTNYGGLVRGPAVRIVSYDGSPDLTVRLDDIFRRGVARFHRGGGRVNWLEDAWFDAAGKRLFIVSQEWRRNPHGREIAIIDAETGQVTPGTHEDIVEQLTEVERRHLHAVVELAVLWKVDGIDDIARRIFSDDATPLSARLRAAAHLARLGNAEARSLIDQLAAIAYADPQEVNHPAVSSARLYDHEYYLTTLLYAKKVYDETAGQQE